MKKLFILAVAVVLVTTGCGMKTAVEKNIEKQLEESTGQAVNLDIEGGKTTLEVGEGMTIEAGEGVSLPDNFPNDVYVIEGKIISAMENIVQGGQSVVIVTEKSIIEARALYEEKLKEADWSITFSSMTGDMAMMSAQKGDRIVSLSISKDEDNQTNVVLTVVE